MIASRTTHLGGGRLVDHPLARLERDGYGHRIRRSRERGKRRSEAAGDCASGVLFVVLPVPLLFRLAKMDSSLPKEEGFGKYVKPLSRVLALLARVYIP